MYAAMAVAEDPCRRVRALDALGRLAEAMLAWPADTSVVVSAEVEPREMLRRIESDTGAASTPPVQVVTVAPGDTGTLTFWFVWAPGCYSQAPGPVLHPIGPIGDIKTATTKLGVMLALLQTRAAGASPRASARGSQAATGMRIRLPSRPSRPITE